LGKRELRRLRDKLARLVDIYDDELASRR